MSEQTPTDRCPECGEHGALVVRFEYAKSNREEREVVGAQVHCQHCAFSKVLVGFPARTVDPDALGPGEVVGGQEEERPASPSL